MSDPAAEVVVLGGGAAGLFCAFMAGRRGRRVRVLERANRVGKKILMSGGGRCNFTNLRVGPEHFLSANPHFCKSALARYKPEAFIALVNRHGIAWHEKELGQLFCDDSSKQIVKLLLDECAAAQVRVDVECEVHSVEVAGRASGGAALGARGAAESAAGFVLQTSLGELRADKLVVATGGLSIPTMGATGFGYELARQFGHDVLPTRAGLVPLTLSGRPLEQWHDLSGVSLPVSASANGARFDNAMLITHRGLSGPAMLQISNYWEPGRSRGAVVGAPSGATGVAAMLVAPEGAPTKKSAESSRLRIDLLPGRNALEFLIDSQTARSKAELVTVLADVFPKRFAQRLCDVHSVGAPSGATPAWPRLPMAQYKRDHLRAIAATLHDWPVTPSGTEGYRTAEVTLGGVDTREISSTTFESKRVPGLYFIGEVLDVTGWLGGYNFQWAWASGHACGEVV